ncbi:hypothetical protein LTR62_007502 [Meristemomyces frigidus]|uniref:Tyrosine specific protein phosphatases domain-containing protein n=1 Tax=Meristemomyces frigidus TaxID=1508187 RepID=A0AAN7TC93_9PEZI|nr:hypothetical protein LTR62_007502 [Meristemomyces frigidus]
MATVADSEVGLPGQKIWSAIKVPLFLVAGESDKVTSPHEVEEIGKWLTKHNDSSGGSLAEKGETMSKVDEENVAPDAKPTTQPADASRGIPTTAEYMQLAQYTLTSTDSSPTTTTQTIKEINGISLKDSQNKTHHAFALKTTIFPVPAGHALMYTTATVRILSGLIETFLSHHVDERLTIAWQLQHLTTSGKWDVKNLAKWSSVAPCSEPIAGVFRAMKTMREVDEVHNPRAFVKEFGFMSRRDGVAMVVDISHEAPVYDPKGLEEGGVEYHKFPTVSKLPPTADEVEHFINLIDQLRRSPKLQTASKDGTRPAIGVHCHYGFNRTGFEIVCYLVERLGYRLQDAIEEFAQKRAPGIKHEHFVNELFVRYAVKMDRRGTIVG